MKFGPQTLQGWIIFAMTMVAVALLFGWALGKADIPQGIKEMLMFILGVFGGALNAQHRSDMPPGSTVESTTTVKTPPEVPEEG